jgi:hypothetical protein
MWLRAFGFELRVRPIADIAGIEIPQRSSLAALRRAILSDWKTKGAEQVIPL